MDETKALEKTITGLKTMQNRLRKLLKERDWIVSSEIPRLETQIQSKDEEIERLRNALKIARDEKIAQKLAFEKQIKILESSFSEFESTKDELRQLKSGYKYRSLEANNQFLQEQVSRYRILKINYRRGDPKALADCGILLEKAEERIAKLQHFNEKIIRENNDLKAQIKMQEKTDQT